MPESVRTIMLAVPNTHFVFLSQAILFRGTGLRGAWHQLLVLVAIGGALFAFSLHVFAKRWAR